MPNNMDFDFDFEDQSSTDLLSKAQKELSNVQGHAGPGEEAGSTEDIRKAEQFFDSLKTGDLTFVRAIPTVFPLNVEYFKKSNLQVPKNFEILSAQDKFYWVEVPLLLVQGEKPFYKLQMWMEFGEGVQDARQIPKVYSVFPDSKFATYATVEGKVDVGLGEDLAFKVAAGIDEVALPTSIPIVNASAGGKLAVNAKLASSIGLVAGPFTWNIKRALIQCKFAGENALWTITDKQSLQDENPVFVVILQVPRDVSQVHLKALAQAHRLAPLPRFFARLLDKISPKTAEWLKKGSPLKTPQPISHTISTLT